MTIPQDLSRSGEAEAIILIKAAPQIGQRHGETVCCAGISLDGTWLQLIPFHSAIWPTARNLEDGINPL